MKQFRLVGVTGDKVCTYVMRAGSNLAAGAMWKAQPEWFGIAELHHIEELSSGEKKYYNRQKYEKRNGVRIVNKIRTAENKVRQPKVRVEFSF